MQAGSQGAQVRGTEFSGPVAAGGRFEDTPAALLPSPMLNEPVIHTNDPSAYTARSAARQLDNWRGDPITSTSKFLANLGEDS
ncbi:hypothetical protein QLX08_011530 [Tetragonisca angustula]|uniref:Uncharacterized protein n=1 Tax=Tetragonisca angustula TaxID=166442 RepID=A0AAW0ZAI0_9HYME